MTPTAWTYLGLFDDVAAKYPWRFKVDDKVLDHLLLTEVIHGKPVLLNEGYLVQHAMLQRAVMQRDGLFWELLQGGFVGVLNSGFALAEMPERKAEVVDSMRALVNDQVPGVAWKDLRLRLEVVDRQLREQGLMVPWPPYDTSAGFEMLAQRLLDRHASPHSLGIGRFVGKQTLQDFLKAYIDTLRASNKGPRTLWENLVLKFSNDPDRTNDRQRFQLAMMNLVNEMYHYNMGLMLAADGRQSISVQTQTSPAFDDLLFPPGLKILARDLTDAPRLHVPRSIARIDPRELVKILDPGSRLFRVRKGWVDLRRVWEEASAERRPAIAPELRSASHEYSALLTELLGRHVRYKEPEAMIEYALDAAAPSAGAVGLLVGGIPGGLAGLGIGYALSRMKDKLAGSVIRKFRVEALKGEMQISPELAAYSRRVINVIKRRALPSAIELPSGIASTFTGTLRQFTPPR